RRLYLFPVEVVPSPGPAGTSACGVFGPERTDITKARMIVGEGTGRRMIRPDGREFLLPFSPETAIASTELTVRAGSGHGEDRYPADRLPRPQGDCRRRRRVPVSAQRQYPARGPAPGRPAGLVPDACRMGPRWIRPRPRRLLSPVRTRRRALS